MRPGRLSRMPNNTRSVGRRIRRQAAEFVKRVESLRAHYMHFKARSKCRDTAALAPHEFAAL